MILLRKWDCVMRDKRSFLQGRTNLDLFLCPQVMEAVVPGVPIRQGTGDIEALVGINKVREELGFEPQDSRDDLTTIVFFNYCCLGQVVG